MFSDVQFQELKNETSRDAELQMLHHRVVSGWPSENAKLEQELRPYWDFREEISVYDGILFKGERIIIPRSMQEHILTLIHSSHQGIVKSKQLARDVLFWKGMNKQIEDIVSKCAICQSQRNLQQKEPMMSTAVPELPWQYVSSDLFQFQDQHYMVVIDHYSGYIEVDELKPNHSTSVVIEKLKRVFATHGIPQILYSDPGSEYTSREMRDFSDLYGFKLQQYSAKYSQANGMAEKAVQIAKNLLRKSLQDNSQIFI